MSTNFLDLPEPRSLQDTGIGGDQIEQLLVKTLYSMKELQETRPRACTLSRFP